MAVIQGDVSKLEDLDELFTAVREQAGRLDVLFAKAGTAEHATVEQVTESQFEAGDQGSVIYAGGAAPYRALSSVF